MLTFRTVNRIGIAGQLLLIAGYALGYLSLAPVLVWTTIYVAVMAWGSLSPSLGFYIQQRSSGAPGTIALTYDDGPHPVHTPALLDLLRSANVKATFFCIGRNVDAHPAIARRIVEEGHAIGIHTQDHRWTWGFLHAHGAKAQIERCADAIAKATGHVPVLFRPPFGVTSPATAAAMRACGVTSIAWDLRTFDTVSSSAQRVMKRIDRRLPTSTIALLHDTLPFTVELTASILERCREHGMRLVTLAPASR